MPEIANPPGVAETFVPRSSSNIAAFTYEPDTETLTVEFASGNEYAYANVPQQVYKDWCNEGGSGRFFYRVIRNSYSYEKQ
jgi:lysyl-tRNA synthetase, class II